MYRNEPVLTWKSVAVAGAVIVLLFVLLFAAWPQYRVWQREQAGKAQLREASWNRQIAVEEARAHMESAQLLADAEIVRARGLAEANEIVIQSLGSPEAYLRYLWIDQIQDNQVFYVPTEATLPVLEAGRAVAP